MRALIYSVSGLLGLVSVPAGGETLGGALLRVYAGNPTLSGARARLRGLDEGSAVARAAGRPVVSGSAEVTQDYLGARLRDGGRALTGSVRLELPLFQGGRVRNAVRAADDRVAAGRAELRATEGDIFTEAVGAYMDVIRDGAIVELNASQVKVLETNLEASRQRFAVGDLTRTDVAQSEARLSLARSDLAAAQGRLTVSREQYQRIVGAAPEGLAPPPPLPGLPDDERAAVEAALANNPGLAAAAAGVRAAGHEVRSAAGARLPSLSAISGVSHSDFLGTADRRFQGAAIGDHETSSSVGLSARLPLYQGGAVGARVRQARAAESEALEQAVAAERFVIADARGAFASHRAAQARIAASEAAVAANALALEGTRAENAAGTRTVLDVLNAEQELLNSRVALVSARRDAYVAGFALLNAMGRAERRALDLDGGALYDPLANYARARRSASDWRDGAKPTPQASRTVGDQQSPVLDPVLQYDLPR